SLVAICCLILAASLTSCEECPDRKADKQTEAIREKILIEAKTLPLGHIRLKERGAAFQLNRFQVRLGSEAEAKKYYSETVSPHLNFLSSDTILNSTVKDLLEYF